MLSKSFRLPSFHNTMVALADTMQDGENLALLRFLSLLSQAVEQIETRLKQNRSWKVVTVRCGYHEDRNVARGRHYAAHPRRSGASVTIFEFYDDEEMACESRGCTAPAGLRYEES